MKTTAPSATEANQDQPSCPNKLTTAYPNKLTTAAIVSICLAGVINPLVALRLLSWTSSLSSNAGGTNTATMVVICAAGLLEVILFLAFLLVWGGKTRKQVSP